MRSCPACGRAYQEHPALSRRDNHTEICPKCGMREALEDFGMPAEKADALLKEVSNLKMRKDRRSV